MGNTVRQGLGLNGKHSETGTGVHSETGLGLNGKHSETGLGLDGTGTGVEWETK